MNKKSNYVVFLKIHMLNFTFNIAIVRFINNSSCIIAELNIYSCIEFWII